MDAAAFDRAAFLFSGGDNKGGDKKTVTCAHQSLGKA